MLKIQDESPCYSGVAMPKVHDAIESQCCPDDAMLEIHDESPCYPSVAMLKIHAKFQYCPAVPM